MKLREEFKAYEIVGGPHDGQIVPPGLRDGQHVRLFNDMPQDACFHNFSSSIPEPMLCRTSTYARLRLLIKDKDVPRYLAKVVFVHDSVYASTLARFQVSP